LGNQLEHEMALRTNALQPPHQYVPWVTLNGVHTERIQTEAQNNLIQLICDTYQGSPKPQGCSQSQKV
jgi:interferon gamma-inducible protein 30